MYTTNVNTDYTIIFQLGLFIYKTSIIYKTYLWVHIKQFYNNQCWKSDSDNISKALVKEHDSSQHNHATLEYTLPQPY